MVLTGRFSVGIAPTTRRLRFPAVKEYTKSILHFVFETILQLI
jgi:hypothetical protein